MASHVHWCLDTRAGAPREWMKPRLFLDPLPRYVLTYVRTLRIRIYVRTYVCTYVCTYVYIYVYVYVYVRTYVYLYVRACTYVRTYVYVYCGQRLRLRTAATGLKQLADRAPPLTTRKHDRHAMAGQPWLYTQVEGAN